MSSAEFLGPVFIVGMPRSGTKLLRELLNRHPRIAIPDAETEFLPWLVAFIAKEGDIADRGRFDRLYRRLSRQSFFRYRAEKGRSVSADAWYRACHRFDAAGLFETLIRLDVDAPRASNRIWGDKSPSYIDDVALLGRMYPQARVIHIVRDVRDYCHSVNHAWGKDMRRAASRWATGVLAARRAGTTLGSRYMEVRFEALLRNPEATLSTTCAFIGVDFQPGMLKLERPVEDLGQARGAQHIVADNQGKFAQRMDETTLADVEQIAAEAMRAFGYVATLPARASRPLMPLRLAFAQVHDALQLVRHRARGRGVLQALVFHLRYFLVTRA